MYVPFTDGIVINKNPEIVALPWQELDQLIKEAKAWQQLRETYKSGIFLP